MNEDLDIELVNHLHNFYSELAQMALKDKIIKTKLGNANLCNLLGRKVAKMTIFYHFVQILSRLYILKT